MENLIVAAAKKRFLEVYCLTKVCFSELLIMNRRQTVKHSNLKLNNQILWPVRTRKTQIIQHLNNEKCEATHFEQKRSQLISR